MTTKTKHLIRGILSTFLALFFLYYAFRGVNYQELLTALKGANYGWVILLIPIVLMSHWVRAVRWKYLMEPIKPNCSIRNLFAAVMIGYAVNNVVTRVGELVRPYLLGNLEHVSRTATLATVVVERILDLLSFYITVCFVLFLYPTALDPFFDEPTAMRPILLLSSLGGIVFFLILFFQVENIFRFIAKVQTIVPEKYSQRIQLLFESFYRGFEIVKVKKRLGIILFLSLTIQALYALGMYEPFFVFTSMVKPSLDFGASVVLLVVSSIAWILPAPGALGTYHSFITVALVKLYNVDWTTALSYTIITHEIGYIIVMVVGAYYYIHDHINVKAITQSTTENEQE
ncbi:MAG: flippase-like domain-containing protein [Bacteroidetes bacterium]|nr:flippase-like domain-containing protein [Bacteroidota bacterium]